MEAQMSNATKIRQKEQKETTKRRRIILNHNGPKVNYNSTHKPQRSLNETLGLNHGHHQY